MCHAWRRISLVSSIKHRELSKEITSDYWRNSHNVSCANFCVCSEKYYISLPASSISFFNRILIRLSFIDDLFDIAALLRYHAFVYPMERNYFWCRNYKYCMELQWRGEGPFIYYKSSSICTWLNRLISIKSVRVAKY